MMIPRLKYFIYFCSFLLITTFVYWNSLDNAFMMDDDFLILQDPKLHQMKYWYYQFIPDLDRHLNLDYKESSAYYRPFAHILPMIGYCLFKENVVGYHIMNLLLFVCAGFLLFMLLKRLIHHEFKAFLTTALFLVHPLNGLFVNYITASVFAAQVIFITLSIWFLLDALNRNSRFLFGAAILMALGALLCHETSLILSGYMLLILWLNQKKSLGKSICIILPFVFLSAAFFIFRLFYASLRTNIMDKASALQMNFFEYAATFVHLIGWYLSKIILPEGIVLIWAKPIVRNELLFGNLIFFMVIAGLLFLFRFKEKYPDIVLGIYLFVIGLLPVMYACVFKPTNGLMIEPHWLFFPSIGLFWVLVSVVYAVEQKIFSSAGYVILTFLIVINGFTAHKFNEVWGDERQYCANWVKHVPHFKSAYFYLGNAYLKQKEDDLARENFLKALEGKYNDWQIYSNLGLMDQKINKIDDAEENYRRALALSPKSVTVNNNLGLLLYHQGRKEEAKDYFINAITYNGFYLEPRLNFAKIYRDEGKLKEAEELYKENLNIISDHHETIMELMDLYLEIDDKAGMEKIIDDVLKRSNTNVLLSDLGGISARHGQFLLAEVLYSEAIQRYPHELLAYRELGKLYANTSRREKALDVWGQALKMTPHDQEILDRMNEIKR